MSDEQNTEKFIQAAKFPTLPVLGESFTDRVIIEMTDGDKSFTHTIAELVSEHLEGCSRVDLHSLTVSYQTAAADNSIAIGIVESSSTKKVGPLSLTKEGHRFRANARTYGNAVEVNLIPPGLWSRQIRPTPSDLPTFQLVFEKKGTFSCIIEICLIVRGPRTKWLTLS